MSKLNGKQKVMSVLLSGVVASTFFNMGKTLTSDKPVTISKDLSDSLYTTYSSFFTPYTYDEENFKLSDINYSITSRNLDKVTNINIHADKFDFDDLELMPNLITITVDNANALTSKDKSKLASCKARNIVLNYNFKNFTINSTLDLGVLKHKKIFINCPAKNKREEIESLIFFNIYENLSEEERSFIQVINYSKEEMDKLASWNNKLNNIISGFNFTSQTSDIDKLIAIVNYVTSAYTYDSAVNGNDLEATELSSKYYETMISNILDDNNEYGTCINFAALTNILSQYVGLDVELDLGKYGDGGHAWNTYNYNGENLIVDTTAIDKYNTYNYYKSLYENTDIDQYTKDLLIESIFITHEYEPNMIGKYKVTKVNYTEKEYNKDVEYINSNSEELVKRKLALEGIVSLSAALILLVGIKIAKDKKPKNKKSNINGNNLDIYNRNNGYIR